MGGFVQARADRAAAHRGASSASQSNEGAGAARATSDPRAQSLLQMRQALDQSSPVRSQAALQRALDSSAAAKAPPKRKGKPPLQMKGIAINDDAGLEREADVMGARAGSIQRVTKPKPKDKKDEVNSPAVQQPPKDRFAKTMTGKAMFLDVADEKKGQKKK
jgi:hypothetical protein